MLAYLDPADGQKELIWLMGLIILVGSGIWVFRKHWKVASIIGLFVLVLGMMVIPSLVPAHFYADQSRCINNLRMIDEAKIRWAADHNKQKTDVPADSDLFGEGLYLKSKPTCPNGGAYTLGKLNENPKCSLAEEKGHKLD